MSRMLTLVLLSGSRRIDDFMHARDVFESFRALAEPMVFNLKVTKGAKSERIVACAREAAEKHGHRVVAAFIVGVRKGVFVDKSVRVISSGQRWCLLRDFLSAWGVKEE